MSQKSINILNLLLDIPKSLREYLIDVEFLVFERNELENYEELDFILVSSLAEAESIAVDYAISENNIKIICVGNVEKTKDFFIVNGRLAVNESIAESQVGKDILNKFFFEESNIETSKRISSDFKLLGEFSITNHLASGEFLDEASVNAMSNGFDIVSLRSFVDHGMFYAVYLKQAGLSGYPLDCEYGISNNSFIMSITISVKEFFAEYLIDSFNDVESKEALRYLLNIVKGSCDFLDITYLEKPSKLTLTGFWSRAELNPYMGISFNNIRTLKKYKADITNHFPEVISKLKKQNLLNEKLNGGFVFIHSSLEYNSLLAKEKDLDEVISYTIDDFEASYPNDSLSYIKMEHLEESLAKDAAPAISKDLTNNDKDFLLENLQKKESLDRQDESLKVKKLELAKNDDEFEKKLSNEVATSLAKKIISDMMEVEASTVVAGEKAEQESFLRIKGTKEDIGDAVLRIKSRQGEQAKTNHFQLKLEENIDKASLKIEDDTTLLDIEQILEKTLVDSLEGIFLSPGTSQEFKEEAEKNLVKEVSMTLDLPLSEIETLIKNSKKGIHSLEREIIERKFVEENINLNPLEVEFAKLRVEHNKSLKENEELNKRIDTLQIRLNAQKVADEKVISLVGSSPSAPEQTKENHSNGLDLTLKEKALVGELEKMHEASLTAESAIEHIKKTNKVALESKDREIEKLKEQVNSISQKISGDKGAHHEALNAKLEKEKENLEKSLNLYKGKIEKMSEKLSSNRKEGEFEQVLEENRNLKRIKKDLEMKFDEDTKRFAKIEDRYQELLSQELKMKADLKKVQLSEKSLMDNVRFLKDKQAQLVKKIEQSNKSGDSQATKEIEFHKSHVTSLQSKLKQLEEKAKEKSIQQSSVSEVEIEKKLRKGFLRQVEKIQRDLDQQRSLNVQYQNKMKTLHEKFKKDGGGNSSEQASSALKVKRLEQTAKNLTAELAKANAENSELKVVSVKFKKEVIGLKNKLDLLQREIEKYKKNVKKAA